MLGLPPSTTRTHTLVPYTTLFRAQTPAQRDENGDADQRKDEQRPGEADDRQDEEGRDRGADDGAEPEGGRYERQCLRALLGVGARDRKSTRLNSSHLCASRMPASAGKKKQKPRHDDAESNEP